MQKFSILQHGTKMEVVKNSTLEENQIRKLHSLSNPPLTIHKDLYDH